MPLSPRRTRANAMEFNSTVSVLAHHDLKELLDLALLRSLRVHPVADHLLFSTHMVDEALDRLGEISHRGRSGLAGLDLIDGATQTLDRGTNLAGHAGHSRRFSGLIVDGGGQPILEFRVEAVLRLARLQIEETEHERAGEAEQRGGKGNTHAREGCGEAVAQRVEHRTGIATCLQTLNDIADRTNGFDEAPKSTEQTEENEEPCHIPGNVARLVEASGNRVENSAHQLRGHGHASDATAKDRCHGREKDRRPVDRQPGIGKAEIIDPRDFRIETQHLTQRQHNSDCTDAEDERVQARIGHECDFDLLVQHKPDQTDQDDEYQHPDQKDAGRRQLERIEVFGHELRNWKYVDTALSNTMAQTRDREKAVVVGTMRTD